MRATLISRILSKMNKLLLTRENKYRLCNDIAKVITEVAKNGKLDEPVSFTVDIEINGRRFCFSYSPVEILLDEI